MSSEGKPSPKCQRVGILHYSAPPVVGGVEAVIRSHAQVFLAAGYRYTVLAGRGDVSALPAGAELVTLPEMDSQHPMIGRASEQLERGVVPANFEELVARLAVDLEPVLSQFDCIIIHNILFKHFNLPLTAALFRLLDAGVIHGCIAWGHDFTWSSPHSRSMVSAGYPWDLLKTYREDVTYVTVSHQRRVELAGLLRCSQDEVRVVYNGVDPESLLGLSPEGWALIDRLNLFVNDLVLLMPVRVTRAKNIEFALHTVAALKARGYSPKLVLTGPPDPHDERSMAYFASLQALRRQLDVEQEMRFVFESGVNPAQPYTLEARVVGDLYRVSDVLFMPSLREGFGIPLLEAGLAGLPVVCTGIPAAREICGEDVDVIVADQDPAQAADRIILAVEGSPVQRLRRKVRQSYTWKAIFERDIKPLIDPVNTG